MLAGSHSVGPEGRDSKVVVRRPGWCFRRGRQRRGPAEPARRQCSGGAD